MFLQPYGHFEAVHPPAPAPLGPEQVFMESLTQRLQQANPHGGGSQQDCISQLRALNLGDDFWMHIFKVVPCAKTYSHKWTLCPCAHAGETARRRDPRTVSYKAVLCPLVKAKKTCPLGDACSYAHNVFEHWLHPSRYKTRLCSFGRNCNRPICFFAHSAEELRCVPNVEEGKELDEREYLLQLMMAQESGLLPGSTAAAAAHHVLAQQHAQHAAQQQAVAAAAAMPGPPQRQSSGHLDLAGLGSGAGSRIKTPTRTSAPAIPTVTSPEHMLMNLQEALANVSLSVDGLSAVSGAPHIGAGRTSDPGLGPAGLHMAAHAISAVHPLPHMNRISDSGQTLGLASPKGLTLESLLPLVNSLAAQQKAAQQAQAQAQAHAVAAAQQMVRQASFGAVGSPPRSPPPPARSSTPGTSTPGSSCDGLTAAVQHVTGAAAAAAAAGSPVSSPQARMQPASPMPSQTQAQALQVLQAAAAVAASSPGINPAYVNKIMGELQEQGLAGSKEQLVASLSQLLAQLLQV